MDSLERKSSYYIVSCPYDDWVKEIKKYTNIEIVSNISQLPNDDDIKIIPVSTSNRILLKDDPRAIFKTDMKFVNVIEDKCLFALFMMQNFPQNIPETIYIKRELPSENHFYVNRYYHKDRIKKIIQKKAIGAGGNDVKIVNEVDKFDINFVASEYIEHSHFYTSHCLVINGTIVKHIYFRAQTHNRPNFIQRGKIKNYEILTEDDFKELTVDLDVFEQIFKKLNYSGFACPNFIIKDKHIVIFEINARPGGSLIIHPSYCHDFFQMIIDNKFT